MVSLFLKFYSNPREYQRMFHSPASALKGLAYLLAGNLHPSEIDIPDLQFRFASSITLPASKTHYTRGAGRSRAPCNVCYSLLNLAHKSNTQNKVSNARQHTKNNKPHRSISRRTLSLSLFIGEAIGSGLPLVRRL